MTKIILNEIETTGDLVKALQSLPENTSINPFGSMNCVLAYDEEEGFAYLDERSFIEEKISGDEEMTPDMES